jgi:hypothetical protein
MSLITICTCVSYVTSSLIMLVEKVRRGENVV